MTRVEETARFVGQDAPMAARTWVKNLFDKVAKLEQFPRVGRIVPEIGKEDIRELIFGSYRIVYRIDERRVVVLTLRHCRLEMDEKEIEEAFPKIT